MGSAVERRPRLVYGGLGMGRTVGGLPNARLSRPGACGGLCGKVPRVYRHSRPYPQSVACSGGCAAHLVPSTRGSFVAPLDWSFAESRLVCSRLYPLCPPSNGSGKTRL